MMRIVCCSVLLVFSLAVLAAEQPVQGGAALELVEHVRVAFYERAPADIASSMGKAVERQCEARRRAKTLKPGSGWLCKSHQHLHFLRSVDVVGKRQKTGFVCNDKGITPNLKYYLDDMITDNAECVFVSFDVRTNRHSVESGEDE